MCIEHGQKRCKAVSHRVMRATMCLWLVGTLKHLCSAGCSLRAMHVEILPVCSVRAKQAHTSAHILYRCLICMVAYCADVFVVGVGVGVGVCALVSVQCT